MSQSKSRLSRSVQHTRETSKVERFRAGEWCLELHWKEGGLQSVVLRHGPARGAQEIRIYGASIFSPAGRGRDCLKQLEIIAVKAQALLAEEGQSEG